MKGKEGKGGFSRERKEEWKEGIKSRKRGDNYTPKKNLHRTIFKDRKRRCQVI